MSKTTSRPRIMTFTRPTSRVPTAPNSSTHSRPHVTWSWKNKKKKGNYNTPTHTIIFTFILCYFPVFAVVAPTPSPLTPRRARVGFSEFENHSAKSLFRCITVIIVTTDTIKYRNYTIYDCVLCLLCVTCTLHGIAHYLAHGRIVPT